MDILSSPWQYIHQWTSKVGDNTVSDVSINIDNRKDVLLLLLLSPGQSQEKNEPISGRTRYMKLVYLFYKELVRDLSSFNAVNEEKRH